MSLPAFIPFEGKQVALKYHKLLSGTGEHPANSLAALEEVLAAEVAVIEFDIRVTADGHFVLTHDAVLQNETTGHGRIREFSRQQLEPLHYRNSQEPLAFLSQVVERLKTVSHPLKVQVDFKEALPVSKEEAETLLAKLEPLQNKDALRVVIGCLGDWNLRLFRRLNPEQELGLDFAFHLDAPVDGPLRLPSRVNAYGYLDDHPLGFQKMMSAQDYLQDRLETLLNLVPKVSEVYLRKDFVFRALDDGFDPVAFIHDYLPGSYVDVWTIDDTGAGSRRDMKRALAAGANQITTNTALQWGELYKQ